MFKKLKKLKPRLKTMTAAAKSLTNPLDGLIDERLVPIVLMTRLPNSQRPIAIPAPP